MCSPEQRPESRTRFSDKICGKNKNIKRLTASNKVETARYDEHQRVLILVAFVLFSGFAWLMLSLLGENINYFKTPSLITLADRQRPHPLRLGGIVKAGSVIQRGSHITFLLSDGILHEKIRFRGVLPDLFREGQGVVVDGQFDLDGVFIAHRILAKHDENYMSTNPTRQLSLN